MLGDVYNVVTCAKFHVEIFSGCNFTEVEFSMFVLIFAWALQQFSANTSGSKDQTSTSQETEVVFGHLAEASFSTSLGRAVFLLPILCSIYGHYLRTCDSPNRPTCGVLLNLSTYRYLHNR